MSKIIAQEPDLSFTD